MFSRSERKAAEVQTKSKEQKIIERAYSGLLGYHEKKLRPHGDTGITPWKTEDRIECPDAGKMYEDLNMAAIAGFLIPEPKEVSDADPEFTFVRVVERDDNKVIEFGIGCDWVEDGYPTHYYYGLELNLSDFGQIPDLTKPMVKPFTEYEDPSTYRTRYHHREEPINPRQLEAISTIINRYSPPLV